jgi:endonuclease III-like uncharacterized protein
MLVTAVLMLHSIEKNSGYRRNHNTLKCLTNNMTGTVTAAVGATAKTTREVLLSIRGVSKEGGLLGK